MSYEQKTVLAPSKAAIGGHPLHPILIPFPIAFLSAVPLTDLIRVFGGADYWAHFSYWLLLGGLVSGVVAALPGIVDFLGIAHARRHSVGWIHALLNVGVLVLAAANLFARRGAEFPEVTTVGVALSAVTFLLLLVTGWAGGELAYRHHIGMVEHESHPGNEPAGAEG